MPYSMEDFKREYMEDRLEEMTPEARRKLFGRLTPQERLETLSLEEIESYLQRCKQERESPKRKKKK